MERNSNTPPPFFKNKKAKKNMEGESESAKPSFHWFSFVHVSMFSPVAKEVTPCFPLTAAAATKPPGTAPRHSPSAPLVLLSETQEAGSDKFPLA